MKSALISSLLVGLILGLTVVHGESSNALESVDRDVKTVFNNSRQAVVKIHAHRQSADNDLASTPSHRVGTGFFVSNDGLVLTAGTVIGDADTCWVEWQDEKLPAHIVGRCPRVNLAVLKVQKRDAEFPALKTCGAPDYAVGSLVIALGYPYDLPAAPVVGFIQGIDIRRGDRLFPTSHIRANCRLNPGQGGGPLLNAKGEVIGVIVAAHMDDQAYALPICAAKKVYKDIVATGQAQHPWVGLEVSERELDVESTPLNRWQVYVRQVISNTPAAQAGFQDRDLIVRIGTNSVHRLADVLDSVFLHHAGDQLDFTVVRRGKEEPVALTLGGRSDSNPDPARPAWVPVSKD